jgi:hypothetical protein
VLISAGLDRGNRTLTGLGELRAPKSNAAGLSSRKGLSGPRRYQGAFLLRESGKEMQHERINISPQLCDHEWHAVGHKAADEMNVAAEAVQLGDGDGAFELFGSGQSGLKLRATVKGIGTLAGLNLNELTHHLQALSLGKLA